MYFDFEDLRPETPTLETPISRREAVLLTIILHLSAIILLLVWPHLPFVKAMYARQEQALEEQRRRELEELQSRAQFVFVEPKIDLESRTPPKTAQLSDKNRRAQTIERAQEPKTNQPFSRGNTPEKVITDANPGPKQQAPPTPPQGDQGATPNAAPSNPDALALPNSPVATIARNDPDRSNPTRGPAAGVLSDAIRNVQRYAKGDSLQNVQGNGDFGPSIQFDTKGVDFGPWLRRFVAQIRRNWFVPYAAMALHGHVVLTFVVHRDGSISELQIRKPSDIDAFTNSAFSAIKASNPTMPLPPEYPDDQCFFTVTFYFNETPPGGSP
jgi:TonB family protein